MYLGVTLSLIFISLGWLYYRITRGYGSFKSRGYPEEVGTFPFGSKMFWDMYLRRRSLRDFCCSYKKKYPLEKFFIAWDFGKPVVIVLDVDLAKNVLVKDFEYFPIRRPFPEISNSTNLYMARMMPFVSNVDKWKKIRSMMSPVFTSGKLKAMLPHLQEGVDYLMEYITKIDTQMVDSRDIVVRYTTQSIAKAGFGVEANCFDLSVKEPLFMEMVNIITGRKGKKWRQVYMFLCFLTFPNWFTKHSPISLLDPGSKSFFINMVKSSIENRKKSKVSRGDFVDLLLAEFYKNTSIKQDEIQNGEEAPQFEFDAKINIQDTKVTFDEQELELVLVANVLILLMAGFDTTSSMMTVMFVYLANHPIVQEKLFEEISGVIHEKNNGDEKLNYMDIRSLKYLDMFIHEVLRHFPFINLERTCIKKYKMPGTDLDIEKNTLFLFPNDAFNLCKDHYEEPEVFNPNNFTEENKIKRSTYSFLAFGQGPRNCIGMRFAMLQMKTCLYRLVYKYKFLRNEKTVDEILVAPNELSPDITGGSWVTLKKRRA
ncbi:CYP6 [Lepeophtheirus salmonis]|uniref:CYP6 n=3 Tax=Lepeophtheirus salmonis TaxID=72036 RepID=A0A7R8CXS3_LEPSM|nr:CYP6 [Lepeophtheirus salmonis]CAF2917659.1 CYP6 [Lepeophtheirus salmonis]